jgi:hypothetical protein
MERFIFFYDYTVQRRHSKRMHSHPYEYTHVNPTIEVDGVTTDILMSTGTLPTTLSRGVEPKTYGAAEALVTNRLQVLSLYMPDD